MRLVDSLFVHYRPDERPFVERSLDWVARVVERHQVITTLFLDPREQEILRSIAQREPDVQLVFAGGSPYAERCRAMLGFDYLSLDTKELPLSFIRITSTKGEKLEHRDVLGSLSGLGIKRETIGDIYPHQQGCDLVCATEMKQYILLQLQKVGKDPVRLFEIQSEDLQIEEQMLQKKVITCSSLRLDTIVAEAYQMSRSKAVTMVKNGKCKVNWKIIEKPDFPIEAGDLISLRGYGRIKVLSLEGITKKGKNILQIASFS